MVEYFRNIWVATFTIAASMKVAFRHLFIPATTLQYPNERREDLPEWRNPNLAFTRHELYVDIDDCIGCLQCERACPVECITIETIKTLPDEDLGKTTTGNPKRLWVPKFDIDMAKCCYCGLCIYPCPTECIHMTPEYEYSVYDRNGLNYRFGLMTEEEAATKRAALGEHQKKEAERKAAAKAKAGVNSEK